MSLGRVVTIGPHIVDISRLTPLLAKADWFSPNADQVRALTGRQGVVQAVLGHQHPRVEAAARAQAKLADCQKFGLACDPGGMTERKPAAMSFTSWIDQQISDAQQRGAFDDLPGAGKPLPKGKAEFDGQAWARNWVRREGGSPEDCLPTPLRLRKELERLDSEVAAQRSEEKVRERVDELNKRILAWRRLPFDGPPIHVPLADTEAVLGRWREARAAAATEAAAALAAAAEPDTAPRSRAFWKRRTRA